MIGLIAPCTVSFGWSDLGKFDKETEIKLSATNTVKNCTKTKSAKVRKKRNVYTDVILTLTVKWSKASYDSFISASNSLADEGTLIIDSDDFNIIITNMTIESESFQSFDNKAGFNLTFTSLDKFANITITEK